MTGPSDPDWLEQARREGRVTEVHTKVPVATAATSPPPAPRRTRGSMREAEFQNQVIEYARLRGWRVYHTYDSRRSEAGFPDLVFGRGPGHALRVVVAELKVPPNKPTAEQYAWLGHFQSMGIPTYVWFPADWPEIERVLA